MARAHGKSRTPAAIWRFGLAAALAGYAAVALLSGTDRLSQHIPATPAYTGWPYATGAQRAAATYALINDHPDQAAALARSALRSSPIESLVLSLLGQAEMSQKKFDEADKIYRVAGQLGWRDAAVQVYWMGRALDGGDTKIAAERLDALLRQTPDYYRANVLIGALIASPEGRAQLAERLKLKPDWSDTFVSDVQDLTEQELGERAEVMRLAGRGIWTCPATGRFASRLVSFGRLTDAETAWRINCLAPGSTSLVYDGSFDALDPTRASTAFEWALAPASSIDARVIGADGGHRLRLHETAGFPTVAVSQYIMIAPGRYRAEWTAMGADGKPVPGLAVSFDCDRNGKGIPGDPVPGKPGHFARVFDVDSTCPARYLGFHLVPGQTVDLEAVSLTRQG